MKWIGWTTLILGIWLLIAPFALGYTNIAVALWNDILLGVLVAIFGGWAAVALKQTA
jgi:hypothetical protein